MRVTLIGRPSLDMDALVDEFNRARSDQFNGSDAAVLIELAGRECYDSAGTGRNSSDYAEHILAVNHGSVLEHAQYSFLIRGVSRCETHEHVRHRAGASVSQRSTRYVDETDSPTVWHPIWELAKDAILKDGVHDDMRAQMVDLAEDIESHDRQARRLYARKVDLLQRFLEERGVKGTNARKQARGAARAVLPMALETSMVWSANVRALRHFFDLRASAFADAEIRAVAIAMLRIMQVELPPYFGDYLIEPSADGIGESARRA